MLFMNRILFVFFFLSAIMLHAQVKKTIQIPTYTNVIKSDSGFFSDQIIVDGDTCPHIKLYKIVIYPERKFKSPKEKRRYYRLERNVKAVYPYAVLIGEYYAEINRDLEHIPSKLAQREYLRKKEKELKKQYYDALYNLTFTQGRILLKLVDRQTSHTTFEVVQQLKGNMNAYFWQSLAVLFGDNLKSEYDPKEEDKFIEEIIAKIENGQLK